jgi:hypothetical protein
MNRLHRIAPRGAFGVFVLALAAGCGEPAPPPAAADLPAATAPATPAPTISTKSARDIAAIEACQLVPVDEVASIAGGKSATTESAWKGPHCMYVIEVADGTEGYTLHFSAANEIAVVLDVMSADERGEVVPGPWQEAYLGPKSFGEGLRMLVLDRDDFAFEVSGESRREPILELARRAYERAK